MQEPQEHQLESAEQSDQAAQAAQATASEELITPDVVSLEEQVQALEAERAALNDALLRAHADAENQRRRHQDELAAAHKYAINKFASELIVVKDYLEMALLDQSGQIDALKMGVDMTLKALVSAFDKVQIKDIAPQQGDKLDPHQHQAMSAEEAEGEANSILRVMQKGYLLADRVLRPAMVIVVKPKET